MKRIFLFFLFPITLFAQTPEEEEAAKKRQEKIEFILRLQDLRSISEGSMLNLLSDPDPIVRERAFRAYGSIQDTSVLHLLVNALWDKSSDVQFAAAFAIGQTAGLLNKKNRERLQYDLIWARLDRMSMEGKLKYKTSPADRLIEEIGKFGTEEALRDLLLRFGDVYPLLHSDALVMSIARFAIRGITSPDAVRYLIKLIKPVDGASWQTAYALQRIGDHPEIRAELEHVVQLYKHREPLVRMNLATLLGKIKDERTSLLPLQKLADFDPDWRVRVNALKALSNFSLKGNDDIIHTLRRSFYHGNTYVALTALSAFGNTGLKESDSSKAVQQTFAALKRIAENKDNAYIWQLQAEAATALAKLSGASALASVHPTDYPQPLLQAQLLRAMGLTGARDALHAMTQYLEDDNIMLWRASLEALHELSKKNPDDSTLVSTTYDAIIVALESGDVALVTTAASILGDSLFLRPLSISHLLEALSSLRVPDDVEAIQEIAATLGKLKDDRAVEMLRKQLQQPDRSVMLASVMALKSITGRDYSSELPKYFEPLLTDFDFAYLRTLPNPLQVRMETIRGDIVLELYKDVAPFTVMSFLKLTTQRGFFRGLTFHRVVPNFVIQGGDPRGDGWGGPGYSIRSEFSPFTYQTGTLGMASAGKDTEGSQFFITQSPQPHLDGRYTIFGKVISGMDVVNRIQVDDHIFDVKILE
ncbi:MAG: peptidylprolyl isomerase [Ignavibacteriae bacterium]|nr:peptidylprolyl isomerase [Ignavibacteriota bacterium]